MIRTNRLARATLLCVLIGPAPPASAILVKPDGTGDYPTIQAAIDASEEYTVIELADGTFTGEGNRNIDFRGKRLVVTSQSRNAEACVIDARASEADPARVVMFLSREEPSTRLEYVTIQGGYLPEVAGWQQTIGAGIYIKQASPSITGCIVRGNYCTGGGALMCYLDDAIVTDCIVRDNHIGLSGHLGETTITRCTIEGNTDAGVVNLHSNMAFFDCVIRGNATWGVAATEVAWTYLDHALVAENGRGGLLANDRSSFEIRSCRVVDNLGPSVGGIWVRQTSTLLLVDSIVAGNDASGADGWGGALRIEESSASLSGSTLLGNTATRGGAVYAENATLELDRMLLWQNCATEGDAAYLSYPMSGVTVRCSALDPTAVLAEVGVDVVYEDGPVTGDPLFCTEIGCGDDAGDSPVVTLRTGSPCLADRSPCGERIGVGDNGCPATPISETSWGRLKALFGREP